MSTNSQSHFTRRHLLKAGVFGTAFLANNSLLPTSGNHLWAADAASLEPLNRFPRMVQNYFVEQVREAVEVSHLAKKQLKTKAEAEQYVRDVQAKIADCFGPLPEKTPLNVRVTGILQRDTYRVEKILFESRPGMLVTANLYVPTTRKLPLPGVVGTCGHSGDGKAAEMYQAFAQGLARQGYVVLIYDPLGQGERIQYPNESLKSRVGGGVREHLMAGNQQFLVGDFLGTWRAWDGIRALDYLLTRDEVDPNMVGVTGNSGGGTMTTWLCGVEGRWSMAAPSCFVTSLRRNMENELPADTEQCPPRVLAMGLDHEDFLAAMAPKPVRILTKEKDYFDVRGSEFALKRLKRLYSLLGAEENIDLFTGPTEHGYSQENREAMYGWFNRATGVSSGSAEPELTIEPVEDLWCTPKGQVAGLDSRTVFSFTQEKSVALGRSRAKLQGKKLTAAVQNALKLPTVQRRPEFRILRTLPSRGYPTKFFTTYAVETDPGVQAIVYMLTAERHQSRPPKGKGRAGLYVSHHSADAELRDEPLVKEVFDAEPDSARFACDVRGIGESRPDTCGHNQFLNPYGSDYFYAIHSIMLDYPYVGQKTFDLLRVLDWLAAYGHESVHIVAKGWGAIPATFASLLSPHVTQVTLKNSLTSYAELAQTEEYVWPLSSFVLDVLQQFDLPDCYQALEAKGLAQIDPCGPKDAPA